MTNILYVCNNTSNHDIEYIKMLKKSEPVLEYSELVKDVKFDIIYFTNCTSIDLDFILSYIVYLNQNGIIYINNISQDMSRKILDYLTKKSFKSLSIPSNDPKYINLITQFNRLRTTIKLEMENCKKVSCWAWYVFPTEQPGASDSYKTSVDKFTADLLINNNEWMEIHKIIYSKIKLKKSDICKNIFPAIDIGRIKFFIKFWINIPHFQTEENGLNGYLNTLDAYIIANPGK